jgi:signal transduction histidine kinase
VYFIVGCLVWLLVHMLRDREEQLRQQLDDLEATRGKLIEEEKLAAIGRLASAVAHEIRNPVAIISSALETAASASFASKEREEMSRIAGMEAKRLERLTTDFLSYARPGNATFQQLDATALVGYIVSIVQPQALQKDLQIEVKMCDTCCVYGNEGQLQQALLNLMRNAIEASPQSGSILIAVVKLSRAALQIRIENAGPAIPHRIADHIFEPFFTAKEGGTGLGLAIARSIVDRHHGELYLEQNKPDHIVFTVSLPSINKEVIVQSHPYTEPRHG